MFNLLQNKIVCGFEFNSVIRLIKSLSLQIKFLVVYCSLSKVCLCQFIHQVQVHRLEQNEYFLEIN